MAIQKQSKPTIYTSESEYDFGEPEYIIVEVSNNVSLRFREPDVDDLLNLAEIENQSQGNEIMQVLHTICLLHTPEGGKSKITMKEAKKIRILDLKKIGTALGELVNFEDTELLDNKSGMSN